MPTAKEALFIAGIAILAIAVVVRTPLAGPVFNTGKK